MNRRTHRMAGILLLAAFLLPVSSGRGSAEKPYPVPSGYFESQSPADPATQIFRIDAASGGIQLQFTGPNYAMLPSKGIWEATQYVFIKPQVVNMAGMPVGLGFGPETATLARKNDKIEVSARGRNPFVNRDYVLEPLKGDKAAIIEGHYKSDEDLRKGSLDGFMKFYAQNFRSTVCSDRDALRMAIESSMPKLPRDRVETRTYPTLIVNASRALVETHLLWNAPGILHGDWNLECLAKGKDGWKVTGIEMIPPAFQKWVGERGYAIRGEPLFYPRLPGWAMYSIVSVRPNGSQTYAVTQFSPELDAALSFVVQRFPDRPEDFDTKAFAEGDLPRIKEQYPDFKADKQEAMKIGEREFYAVDCQYRIWFGESHARRYYHLTPEHVYIIVFNSYDEKTWETRRGEVEKAILDAKLP